MSRSGVRRFLYRFDKEPALQQAFEADPVAALADFDLDAEERRMLAERDVAALLSAGVHPLLIRNFSGTLKIDYVAAYRRAGLMD